MESDNNTPQVGDQCISFSDAAEPSYHCLSNCYDSPFYFDDVQWPTSYHCFEAQKFHSAEIRAAIRHCPLADVRALSWKHIDHKRTQWTKDEQVACMCAILYQKFLQNAFLAQALLGTGKKPIVFQDVNGDAQMEGCGEFRWAKLPQIYYSDDTIGVHHNWLGKVLMRVRTDINLTTPFCAHMDTKCKYAFECNFRHIGEPCPSFRDLGACLYGVNCYRTHQFDEHLLLKFPQDLHRLIMQQLSPVDRMKLHRVCKKLKSILSNWSPPSIDKRPNVAKKSSHTVEESSYSCAYLTYPTMLVSMVLPRNMPKCEVGVMISTDADFKQRFETMKLEDCALNPDSQDQQRELAHVVDFCTFNGASLAPYCGKKNKFFVVLTNEFGMSRSLGFMTMVDKVYRKKARICWDARATFYTPTGPIAADQVEVGTLLLTGEDQFVPVAGVVKTEINDYNNMVEMDEFSITPGHPIVRDNEWYRPDELYPVANKFVDCLYNFHCSPPSSLVVGRARHVCSSLGVWSGRVSEEDPYLDALYGSGYGTPRALRYQWLLFIEKRIPTEMVEAATDRYWSERTHLIEI